MMQPIHTVTANDRFQYLSEDGLFRVSLSSWNGTLHCFTETFEYGVWGHGRYNPTMAYATNGYYTVISDDPEWRLEATPENWMKLLRECEYQYMNKVPTKRITVDAPTSQLKKYGVYAKR